MSGVEGDVKSLVNARDLQLECASVLHESLLGLVLMHGSDTILWKEKERSRVRFVQMDNLRGLLDIRRIERIPNARIRGVCGVKKGLDGRIDEGVLRWFGHVVRMERDRTAKKVYVGECAGTHSVDRPRKRWIDTVMEYLKIRGLDVRQAGRMVQVRSEWRGFVREKHGA